MPSKINDKTFTEINEALKASDLAKVKFGYELKNAILLEIADVWEEYWLKSKVKGTEKGFAERLRERAKKV